jgi:hypothetical protein
LIYCILCRRQKGEWKSYALLKTEIVHRTEHQGGKWILFTKTTKTAAIKAGKGAKKHSIKPKKLFLKHYSQNIDYLKFRAMFSSTIAFNVKRVQATLY